MKKVHHIFLIAILLCIGMKGISQNITSSYEVGTWPGFRSSAISYTFDDGCSNQFVKAIPIFDEFGYKLTLFTVTDWSPNWSKLKSAAANGHEIANHSKSHANFSSLTPEKQDDEVRVSNEIINSNVTSQESVTMAYPYCATGKDTIYEKYFIAARGCQGLIESKTPGSFMNVSSIICGNQGPVLKVKDFKAKADQSVSSKGWLVYLIHGIDNDGGYSPLGSDTLKASLQYLSENDSKFWVNTFGNVARYIKERNNATIKESANSESSLTVEVNDNLDNETFNFPLTVRRPLPEGWASATVTQNGSEVNDTIVEVNSVKYIQFEAVPDGGSVLITKSETTGSINKKLKNSSGIKALNTWINNSMLQFTIPSACLPNPRVTLYNSNGLKVRSFDNCTIRGDIGFICLNTIPRPGIYLVQLDDNRKTWASKIRLL